MARKPVTHPLVSLAVVVLVGVLLLTGCAPPETVTTPPEGTASPPAPSPEKVIEALAFISISVSVYSDETAPQEDGIAVDISFHNSENEFIIFQDIPVTVTLELYGYRDVSDTFDHEKMEFAYQQQVTVDHSMALDEISGKYIRIPYENITVDQNKYYKFGTMKVTVTTPQQRNFQDVRDFIRLYTED